MTLSRAPFDPVAEHALYKHTTISIPRDPEFLRSAYAHFLENHPGRYFVGCRVLDIGAGAAIHGLYVAQHWHPTRYVNVDFQPELFRLAAKQGMPALAFVGGSAFSLPFRTASFDTAWMSNGLFRLRPQSVIVAEVARVLRPGGYFLVVEPNFWCPAVLFRVWRRRRGEPAWSPNDGALFPGSLRRMLTAAGFSVVIRFHWKRCRWLRHRFLSPTAGYIAQHNKENPS